MSKKFTTTDLRNLCIVGSGNTGKTSLTESILYYAGVTTRKGSVEEGNTVTDFNEDEIERKISINLSVVSFEYKNKKLNLIDTPGYADFIGEVFASIAVCETGVLVIDADSGLDAGGENIWEILSENNRPTIIFMNKVDKSHIDLESVMKKIETNFEIKLTPLNFVLTTGENIDSYVDLISLKKIKIMNDKISEEPSHIDENIKKAREKLIDSVASCDDTLIEKYLEGKEIQESELLEGLKDGFKKRKIFPVIFGSGLNSIGVNTLLDFIVQYGPEPEIDKDSKEPLLLVFKTTSEPGMGQMNYAKLYSGEVSSGMDLYNFTRKTTERIGQICFMQGKKRQDVQTVLAGDIFTLIKLKSTRTNDILGSQNIADEKIKKIQQIKFPEPLLDMAIYSKSKGEEEKVGNALQSVLLEDPTLHSHYNAETKEMIVSGMGSMQLEVMVNRIKSRFGVNVELKTPKIPYKETVKGKAEVQGKYKRQSGGRGQYGDCWLRIEPLERGKGFEFVDKIFGGVIPKNYIPAVEKGVLEAMSEGVIAGYPVVDIRVTLFDGSYHEVDSSDMAFKIAGAMALRKGVSSANPTILEPIMNVEVTIPEEYLGSVIGDLNSRRGRVLGMERVGKKHVVKAQVPMSEVFQYATDLRSMTKGAGKFKMSLAYYEELPSYLAQNLIEEYQKTKKQEQE